MSEKQNIMSEDWTWFIDAVGTHILSILEMHNFTQLTGKAYEPDPQPYLNDPIGCVLCYENDKGVLVIIDVIVQIAYERDKSPFYWLRVNIGQDNLKAMISHIATQPHQIYEAQGWVFTEKSEIDGVLIEVAQILTNYLST